MAPNVVWLKKWRPTFSEKHMKTFFLRSHQKRFYWSLWENMFRQKSHKKLFRHVCGNLGKNPSHSQKICLVHMSCVHLPFCSLSFSVEIALWMYSFQFVAISKLQDILVVFDLRILNWICCISLQCEARLDIQVCPLKQITIIRLHTIPDSGWFNYVCLQAFSTECEGGL